MSAFLHDLRDSFRTQPGRVGLSILAIAMGIFSLCLLLAMLGGLENRSQRMIRELGLHVVGVTVATPGPNQERLHRHHVDMLAQNLPGHRASGVRFEQAARPDKPGTLRVLATDEHLAAARNWQMANGRFLDSIDVARSQPSAVVSARRVTDNWRAGHVLPMRGAYLTVVGSVQQLADSSASDLTDQRLVYGEEFVVIPFSLRPTWLTGAVVDPLRVDIAFVKGDGSESPSQMTRRIEALLTQERNLPPRQYITADTLVANVRKLQRTIRLTTGNVAALCLLLGGVTMMSLMIANVKERISEIGLRRALGASRLGIYSLFTAEGIVTTGIASLIGMAAAASTVDVIRERVDIPIQTGWSTWLVAAGTAMLAGILFSAVPARLAAGISPSEALRNE